MYLRSTKPFLVVCGMIALAVLPAGCAHRATPRAGFVHPGLLHTEADFARMREKVAAGESPWIDGWRKLLDSPLAQLDRAPRPVARVVRGGQGQNFPLLFTDVHAAYQLALRWKISGDTAYADKAVAVMDGWSATLEEVAGTSDRFLAAGIYAYQFANAAEIMRAYPGWKPEDFARFQRMMLTVFYPMNHDFLTRHNDAFVAHYWANWDLCNIAAMQAIGVLCDRRDIYDEAIAYLHGGGGNGALDKAVYYLHPGNLGQWQEAGRDQGHTTLGIALMGPICETAWHQGLDLYAYGNNHLLAAAEYTAKYNLGHDVPYQTYAWGFGQRGERREQPVISDKGRGHERAGFELVLNHYANRRGIAAPYSAQYAARLRPEPGGGGHAATFDQVGLGTLTHSLDPQVADPAPSGLVARKHAGNVALSWWGAAGATDYTVKRAPGPEGPYTVVAEGIVDLLAHTDAPPRPGVWHYVAVGRRGDGETAPSNQIRIDTATRLKLRLAEDGVSLNGTDAHLALPAGVVSDLSDFAVAARVRLAELRPGARLLDFGDPCGRCLYLEPCSEKGTVRFGVGTTYGRNEQAIESPTPLPTDRWIHLAVTLSGRVGTLYVDGVPVGANPDIAFAPFRLGATPENWLGRSREPDAPYLSGAIADFRIYDGALAAAEVADLARRASRREE